MSGAKRESALELLRIICMFLIVLAHSALFGAHYAGATRFLACGADIGVDCFVLISGYFMISGTNSLKRMLKMWVTVLTYSAGLYVVMKLWVLPGASWNPVEFILFCVPVFSSKYWFVTAYVLLVLLSPYINRFMRGLTAKESCYYIAALVLLGSVWMIGGCGGRLFQFVLLYSIAAHIRLHGDKLHAIRPGHWFAAAAAILSLVLAVEFVKYVGCLPSPLITLADLYVKPQTSPVLLALSTCFFMGFATWKIGHVRWINAVAACSFAVYLIHNHGEVAPYLWTQLFSANVLSDIPVLPLYCVGVSLAIYIVCTLIEWGRLATLGRVYETCAQRWLLPWGEHLLGRVRMQFDKLSQRIF